MINEQLVRVISKEWNENRNRQNCEMSIPIQFIEGFKQLTKKYPLIEGMWVVEHDEYCKIIQSNYVKAYIVENENQININNLIIKL